MIIIEGPDGSGKTTICKLIAEKLNLNYVKIPRHKEDKEQNGFKFYMEQTEIIDDNSVIDRFHIGECVYPELYHHIGDNRKSLLLWQQHAIERLLMARGCLLIYVNASIDFILYNLEKRGEGFIYTEVFHECELFNEYIFNSNLEKISYFPVNDVIISDTYINWIKLQHDKLQSNNMNNKIVKNTGDVNNPIWIVGDAPGGDDGNKYAFHYWKGSSAYLHQALDIVHARGNFYLTNSNKNIHELMVENFNTRPIIRIALGKNADKKLNECALKHSTIEHPAYHMRFHHDVYAYAKMIQDCLW